MAAITSATTGDWSATGTWVGGVVPGDGDTVTIAAGHTVTVSDARTVGTAGATGTEAIGIAATGSLVIADGGTLTVKGDINVANSGGARDCVWVQAGGTLIGDAPSGSAYILGLGAGTDQLARLRIGGGAGSGLASIRRTGDGTFRITEGTTVNSGAGIYGVGGLFEDLGTSSLFAMRTGASRTGNLFDLEDCEFQRCGSIGMSGVFNAAATFRLVDCRFYDCPDVHDVEVGTFGVVATTGVRELIRCVFTKELRIGDQADWTVEDCYIGGRLGGALSTIKPYRSFQNNVLVKKSASSQSVPGALSSSYLLNDSDDDNPHGWSIPLNGATDETWADNVVEYTGAAVNGDHFQVAQYTSARTLTWSGNLLLPNAAGTNAGSFLSCAGANANLTAIVEHNTWYGGDTETGVKVGETYAGHVGMIDKLRSNLAVGVSAGVGIKYIRMATSTVQDILQAADATHNGGYQLVDGADFGLTPGSAARGYVAGDTATRLVSTGQLGANDVEADPEFFDNTRSLPDYDSHASGLNNSATAWADATGYVVGDIVSRSVSGWHGDRVINYRCIADHTSSSTNAPRSGASWRTNWEYATLYRLRQDRSLIASLITWVREGYRPTNAAYDGAAHDSGTIGAMDYLSTGPTASVLRNYRRNQLLMVE